MYSFVKEASAGFKNGVFGGGGEDIYYFSLITKYVISKNERILA